MNWNYEQPVKIRFGKDLALQLDNVIGSLGYKNGILVSDPFFVQSGLAQKIVDGSKGLLTAVFSEIQPNPTIKNVDDCSAVIRNNKNEFVVALGGGSSLDVAKVAATMGTVDEPFINYHGTNKAFPTTHLPLIAIPTTAGTGSEVSKNAVVTNPENGVKIGIGCENFFPELAIVDPALTYSIPPKMIAQTGLDVLSHAIEGFGSKDHQPICDAVAIYAADLVFKYLERAYKDPKDEEAREQLCVASIMGGMAFALPGNIGPHMASYILTVAWGVAHGEACAMTQDFFLKFNSKTDGGRYDDFAHRLGFKDADAMADRITQMKQDMGMLMTLKGRDLTEVGKQLTGGDTSEEAILKLLKTGINPPSMAARNPRPLTEADLQALMDHLYH